MKDATHFIEVWKGGSFVINGPLSSMKYFNEYIKHTSESTTLKTIAIWKINMKRERDFRSGRVKSPNSALFFKKTFQNGS